MIHDDMLGLIGHTPLVRLNRVTAGLDCTVVAKIEALNPAGSVKDRTAMRVVEEAERAGHLKPGGTIVEATSGNMGVGLSFVAAVKGYRSVVVTTDKQSEEKVNLVKAFGAEVRICPTAVEPDDPRSFYSVAKRIAAETPGAFFANQFFNPANPAAHYATTGPEIWEQTGGRVDVVFGGLGTGGTLCGAGRYLKEKDPAVKIVGIDPAGSLFYDYFHSKTLVKAQQYLIEGIGEDILPSTLDFSVLDDVVRVQDAESFRWARRLSREEGLLSGGSGGAAMAGAMRWLADHPLGRDAVALVIIPERGERALGKAHNDEWMRRNQFLSDEGDLTARDLVGRKHTQIRDLVTLGVDDLVGDAIRIMQEMEVSQIPVLRDGQVVGTIHDDQVIDLLLHTPDKQRARVEEIMDDPVPEVDSDASVEEIQQLFARGGSAVLVRSGGGRREILTKYDLIQGLTRT